MVGDDLRSSTNILYRWGIFLELSKAQAQHLLLRNPRTSKTLGRFPHGQGAKGIPCRQCMLASKDWAQTVKVSIDFVSSRTVFPAGQGCPRDVPYSVVRLLFAFALGGLQTEYPCVSSTDTKSGASKGGRRPPDFQQI